ncbi:uncharacterized protein LOC142240880 [Haematobia irritans]|uniref:uncharacterized protein LOC142240880 n=1 Tax=Haematobia irritans TaxID=7368 RepID=UPI003F5023DF
MQGDGKMVTQSQNIPEPPNRLSAQTDGITEVERATQEHLRLWNEAKLRAEQASLRDEELAKQTAAVIKSQGVGEHSTSDLHKAHEQHLRLVNDLTAKIHGGEASLEHKYVSQLKSGSPVEQTIVSHVETPEVIKAREEHYRLVNEAKLKAENVEHKHQPVDSLKSQAEGLAEIERATQEHLRLWNEAKLRAEQASLKDEELAKQKVTSFQSTPETVAPQPTIGLRSSHEEHLGLINEATAKLQGAQSHVESQVKFDNSQEHYQVHHLSGGVVDTPEVMRAREEHLRLVNEAKLRSESVEHKHDVQVPAIKTVPHQQQSTFQSDHVAVIADTPEVIKAREEHLRLVNEANAKAQSIVHKEEQHQVVQMPVHGERSRLVDDAKVKAQSVDYQTGVVSSPQHQTIVLPEETPEVIEAREQHLRIFNAVKSYIENEEKSKSRLIADTDGKSYTMEEQRIIEEERMREAERLQEEQRQLELDRMREAERLAVEQRQMELELIRLKQEEEQRLQMELMEEKLRLKAEQDQLSQVVIVEEGQRQKDTAPAEKYQQVVLVEENRSNQIPQQAYQPASNPFLPNLKFDTTQSSSGSIQENKFIQSSTQMPISSYSTSHMEKSDTPSMAAVRYIQSSQNSIGSKQQYVQQEVSKTSSDHASFQPADTAAALIHLEKVRQEHFRAHEQALEQLRLARVQSASLKDCNH